MDVRINVGAEKVKNEDPVEQSQKPRIKVLYYDITNFSQIKQVGICSIGVFFFYILYGYLQELIFTVEGAEPYGWYLTLIQFSLYTVFGCAELYLQGKVGERRIPITVYCLLAFLTLGTMGFSNSSLGYLNYPTQVIFKSCKLIPVMIGSILIQQKKYAVIDYIAAILMCAGLTLFTLADSRVSPRFSLIGVLMISCALLCDAAIGNVQEKMMKKYGTSTTELVMYSYGIGFIYLLVIMVLSGGLADGIAVLPQIFYIYASLFSLTGYLGIQIVLTLVQVCGVLGAVTITTCRKAVTIVISFLIFSKPFTFQYVWSGLLIVFAIYLNLISKSNKELLTYLQHLPRQILSHFRPISKDRKNNLATV